MRGSNPDFICGFCEHFTLKDVEPQYAELGLGRCHGFDNEDRAPSRYVEWDTQCVLFRRDVVSWQARKRFVEQQRELKEASMQQGENGIKNSE
jgi:hypothetical protein